MDIVTVKNRSSQRLEGRFDGRPLSLGPHERKSMLANEAEMFKRQNPVMGTEDPQDPIGSLQYLIGVEEWGDDCSELEQSEAVERFDRSMVPDADGQKATQLKLSGNKPRKRVQVAVEDESPTGLQIS